MILTKDYREFFRQNMSDFKRFLRFKGASLNDVDDIIQDFACRMLKYRLLDRLNGTGLVWLTLQRSWGEFYEKKHRASAQDDNYGQALAVFDPGNYADTTVVTSQHLAIYDFENWYLSSYRPSIDSRHRNAVADPDQFHGLLRYMSSEEVDGKGAEYQRFHNYALEYRKFLGSVK
jgi:hypothetical protein